MLPSTLRAGAKRTKAKIVASRLSMIKGSGPGQQTGYQHQTGYQQVRPSVRLPVQTGAPEEICSAVASPCF